jgi:cytochrome c peroxidase
MIKRVEMFVCSRTMERSVAMKLERILLAVCMISLTYGCAAREELMPHQAAETPLIATGRALFNDVKLSGDGKWSCASCHPNNGHTDNKTYVGVVVVADGDPNGRSTPTLWGAGTRQTFSWAGTAPNLQANIRGIIVNRMKGTEPATDTLAALEAYVRSLGFPANPNLNANGTPSAIAPAAAKRGYAVFMRAGCQACHLPPTYDKKDVEDVFSGGKFKIPSLRVVAHTAPYFHDGRFRTLDETVQYMWGYLQKAGTSEKLTEGDLRDLVEFLRIL